MELEYVLATFVVQAGALLFALSRLRSSGPAEAPAAASSSAAAAAAASAPAAAAAPAAAPAAPAPPPQLEVRFYYGSQTGTAEKFAKQLARDCAARAPGTPGAKLDLTVTPPTLERLKSSATGPSP